MLAAAQSPEGLGSETTARIRKGHRRGVRLRVPPHHVRGLRTGPCQCAHRTSLHRGASLDVAPAPRDGTIGLRLFLFKFLSFFGSTLCALLLIEGLLRVYNPLGQRIYGDQIVLPKNLSRTITNEGNSEARLADRIFHELGRVSGGEEPPRDFDDALTVLAIGGSTTECLFLSNGKSWPAVAGDFLSPSFDRFWINNAGLDGHSTFGHLFLLEQIVVPMRSKLALFLVGINDVGRVDATGREMATPWSKPPLLVRMARHSALIAAAVNLVRQGEARARDLGHEQLDSWARPKVEPDRDLAETLLSAHRRAVRRPLSAACRGDHPALARERDRALADDPARALRHGDRSADARQSRRRGRLR